MPYQVIVAEDEPLLLQNTIAKIHSLDLGFQVIASAQTGIQALELIEKYPPPHLLITDVRMPVMNGLELIEKAREAIPDLDCMIISGYSDFEYARQACRLQVFDYLLKPVDPAALKEALMRLKARYDAKQRELAGEFTQITANHSPQEIAETLRQYLNAHYQEDVKINLIAASINYSASQLSKIFQQAFGVTPSRYLITLRISRACRLLATEPSYTVRMIGEMVGYPEQGYFSRIFKKYTGVTPQQYRDSNPAK